MADPKLVKLLRQGAEVWNPYFKERRRADPAWRANFTQARLTDTYLAGAELTGSDFTRAQIKATNLTNANFTGANLTEANLKGTLLTGAKLTDAKLMRAKAMGARFNDADLTGAELTGANILGTFFTSTELDKTLICGVDLSRVNDLASAKHLGPSSIATDPLVLSHGKVPDVFLKGCGLADWEILNAQQYDPDLSDDLYIDIAYKVASLRAAAPIQNHSVFLSYTHADSKFVDMLQAALDENGVRSWRDIHDATAGPMDKIVDRGIRLNPVMLIILSKASVNSEWVRWEVKRATKLEAELERHTLCPISLDDSWRDCR